MDTQNTSERVKSLENLILKYQNSYYNGESEISDSEFDSLWDELRSLDPANPILSRIGTDSGNFQKANHVMPMGSQEKAANPEEFLNWSENHNYPEYLVEYKLDGASLELQYLHGKLLRAVTRGDGQIGDVITTNALKMNGVIKTLCSSDGAIIDFTGGVRGEVIMTHRVHQEHFSDKANCRNAANGIMKRKDSKGAEFLMLITYDVWATEGEQPFSDEIKKIDWLKQCGFFTVELEICKTAQDVIDYRAKVMEKRKEIPYDIDGLVIKAGQYYPNQPYHKLSHFLFSTPSMILLPQHLSASLLSNLYPQELTIRQFLHHITSCHSLNSEQHPIVDVLL